MGNQPAWLHHGRTPPYSLGVVSVWSQDQAEERLYTLTWRSGFRGQVKFCGEASLGFNLCLLLGDLCVGRRGMSLENRRIRTEKAFVMFREIPCDIYVPEHYGSSPGSDYGWKLNQSVLGNAGWDEDECIYVHRYMFLWCTRCIDMNRHGRFNSPLLFVSVGGQHQRKACPAFNQSKRPPIPSLPLDFQRARVDC